MFGINVVVGIFKRHCPVEDTDLNIFWKTLFNYRKDKYVRFWVNNNDLNELILHFE